MLINMRLGWTQGEALLKAQNDTQIRLSPPAPHSGRGDGGERDRSPTRTIAKNPAKKRKVGQTQLRTLQNQRGPPQQQATGQTRMIHAKFAKGGKQICRAFNDGNCKGDTCSYGRVHVCSVIQNSKTCGGKHPVSRHQSGKGR